MCAALQLRPTYTSGIILFLPKIFPLHIILYKYYIELIVEFNIITIIVIVITLIRFCDQLATNGILEVMRMTLILCIVIKTIRIIQ